MIRTPIEARRALAGGTLAGLAAGGFLTLFMTVVSAARDKDVWYGIKGAAAPFLGAPALRPGFEAWPVTVGLFTHLLISIGWGVLFAMLAYGFTRAGIIASGLAWGVVVWLVMYYVVLPLAGLSWMRNDAPVARAVAFHLVYSGALTAALLLYARILDGPAEKEARRWSRPALGR